MYEVQIQHADGTWQPAQCDRFSTPDEAWAYVAQSCGALLARVIAAANPPREGMFGARTAQAVREVIAQDMPAKNEHNDQLFEDVLVCGPDEEEADDLPPFNERVTALLAGRKDDAGKVRYDLIPPHALDALARVLTFGAIKYGPENWRKVEGRRSRYFAAAARHLWAWWRTNGQERDKDTGESHLAHALCCVTFLLDEEESTR